MKLLTPEDTKLLKSEQERTRASNSLGLYTENPSSLRKILASRIATFLEQEDKRVAQEDETRRLANRETLDFFTYLDMHTDYFLVELRKLSGKESLLFDAIMRIYYNECPKLREILLEKQSLQPGER
ncbi:MAG: hypothetical protein LBF15_01855 [Candidatus Peribacteria bacterium]|jgi:hypothetical protein|nr:hypothetical protein [Candidatus Peribacteria bacterium]